MEEGVQGAGSNGFAGFRNLNLDVVYDITEHEAFTNT
jgi:hypothetical protein